MASNKDTSTGRKVKILSKIKTDSDNTPCIKALPNHRCWMTSTGRKGLVLIDKAGTQQREIDLSECYNEVFNFDMDKEENAYFQTMETMDHNLYKYDNAEGEIEDFDEIWPFDAWGIHVTKDGGILTAQNSEEEDGKCVLYTSGGEESMVIQYKGENDPYFDYPIDVTDLNTGDICVADLYKPGVFIFDKEGELKTLYSGSNLNLLKNYHPHSVACDSSDNIFILDKENKRIDIIDKDGVYVCELMTECDGLMDPDSISIAEDGVMWVTQYKNETLVIEYIL
ncbi:hypothetical protein FSP39_013255 [Pinctada imbricata]|uniref:Uncharacterized protein n=1 Tax=Pinctada imbricata TaxID=66713 RepID=A0AA88XNE9_PINIB|nr:hypothetical protein FSP39_013255 [Pinctada imbricata]